MFASSAKREGVSDSPAVYDAPIDYGASRAVFETRSSTSGWARVTAPGPGPAPGPASASTRVIHSSYEALGPRSSSSMPATSSPSGYAYHNADLNLHTSGPATSGRGPGPSRGQVQVPGTGTGMRARGQQGDGYMPLTDIITGLQQMIRSCHEMEGQQQQEQQQFDGYPYPVDRRHPSLTRPPSSAAAAASAAGAASNSLGQWTHVPYAGGPSGSAGSVRVQQLGQAQSAPRVLLVRSGRLRPVDAAGDHRKTSLPDEGRGGTAQRHAPTPTRQSQSQGQSTQPRAPGAGGGQADYNYSSGNCSSSERSIGVSN